MSISKCHEDKSVTPSHLRSKGSVSEIVALCKDILHQYQLWD